MTAPATQSPLGAADLADLLDALASEIQERTTQVSNGPDLIRLLITLPRFKDKPLREVREWLEETARTTRA